MKISITETFKSDNAQHELRLPLPLSIRTLSGNQFKCDGEVWFYRDGVNEPRMNWREFGNASSSFINSAKHVLLWYIQHRSPDHAQNMFNRLLHFVRAYRGANALLDVIEVIDILNYGSSLTAPNRWYLSALAGLFKKWSRLNFHGVSPDVVLLFKQQRLKGNTKGAAVLTMDVDKGPFTHLEVEAIQSEINNAYTSGEITSSDYVLSWLYILLGQRNKQYAALKVRDVGDEIEKGKRVFFIMIPRCKQGYSDPRHAFKKRPIIEQFGEVLLAYAGRVKKDFERILDDPSQAPLFPALNLGEDRGAPGYEFHRTPAQLRISLVSVLEDLNVVSERTGQPLYIMPVRFRRTIGTRAAEEGHPPLVIAELLDQSDTQNVGVYAASSPAVLERIDRAVAMELAPLAQAFAGKLVDGIEGPKNPAKKIIDLRIDRSGRAMGECGQHSFCGFNAPIACYTCNSFEAWLDGPHEAVLNHLIERREKLLVQSDQRMASVNDRTILAVAAVVQKCADIKSEVQGLIHG
ncbi:site-specific integrase [Pseudorhodoferax sp. Leaf265]|uniref:site-specific integrase n=1 Tax=Pseudorhodoferax sp. Leaf265 TaxID=1736315 RepID=UPI000A451821|nr:site-specific integrase [Pseudorhodoferax sp. Leaf265]